MGPKNQSDERAVWGQLRRVLNRTSLGIGSVVCLALRRPLSTQLRTHSCQFLLELNCVDSYFCSTKFESACAAIRFFLLCFVYIFVISYYIPHIILMYCPETPTIDAPANTLIPALISIEYFFNTLNSNRVVIRFCAKKLKVPVRQLHFSLIVLLFGHH